MKDKSLAQEIKKKNKFSGNYIIISVIISIISSLLVIFLLQKYSQENTTTNYIVSIAAAIIIAQILKAIFYAIGIWKAHRSAYQSLAEIRISIVEKLNQLPISFFHSKTSGELSGIMNQDVQEIEKYLAHAQPEIKISLVIPIVSLIVMFFINWKLALALLLPLPVILLWQQIINKLFSNKIKQYMKNTKETTQDLLEYISIMPLIKAFSTEESKTSALLSHLNKYINWVKKATLSISIPMTVIQMFLECSLIMVCLTGIYLMTNGALSMASFVLAIILTSFFSESLINYISFHHMEILLQRSTESIQTILHEPPLPDQPHNPNSKAGDIVFKDVNFHYAGKDDILKSINFSIPLGCKCAIVGPSGSGKTSILNLIMGFWPVSSGSVLIGDQNVSTMNEMDLNNMVSIVQQDSFFFNATIIENLRIGKPDADKEEIVEACKKARIHEEILSLTKGYDSIISESSLDFSGGEKQRLSIARMILKNTPILILDEATASVDSYNEFMIHQALDELSNGKTKITISHNIASILNSDQIIVLEKGQVVGIGKHTELLKNCKIYSNLASTEKQTNLWSINNKGDNSND